MTRRIAGLAATLLVAALLPLGGTAVAQEPAEATVVPVQVTGADENRFVMVVLGDGYTAAELPLFREHVDKHLNVLWSIEPFRSYRNYINVYAVETASAESGVDCDPGLDSPQVDTVLDMGLWGGCNPGSVQRLLTVGNGALARDLAELASPAYDQILALGNSDTYGGAGGSLATSTGGNSLSPLITPHELGHSLGGLQDEYTYYGRGEPGGHYSGGEPASIHHTILTEDEMRQQQRKWWRWLGEESEAGGVIGRYEGGQYNVSGIWRPSKHSMMISLGFYFDQVSRERMTQRISAGVDLIERSTPTDAPVGPTDVVWVETAHPVYHELDVTWEVDGEQVPNPDNRRDLDLGALGVEAGATVTATVVDPTDFVRDPAIRAGALTETVTWTVGSETSTPTPTEVAFTASTQTERPVGAADVVYVETTHPVDRSLDVTWRLDGDVVATDTRNLHLAGLDLSGLHTLTATVTDPADPGGDSQTLTWTVDAVDPSVAAELSEPLAVIERPGQPAHHVYAEQFTMGLTPSDNVDGYVVGEFRLDGDGWHHYYGWPDSPPGTPFLFTPRGTNIADLIYGSLSAEGLSPQPWEPREPGYGTHTVEYRGIDAAGNISGADSFTATVVRGADCTETVTGTHRGPLRVRSGAVCLDGATVTGPVTVTGGASLIVQDSTIAASLTASGAAVVILAESSVGGQARISRSSEAVTVVGSSVGGALSLDANDTAEAVIVADTDVGGALTCRANAEEPDDLGVGNDVNGRRARQC